MRILCLTLLFLATACGGLPPVPDTSGVIDYEQDCTCGAVYDVSISGLYWSRIELWPMNQIPVCWEGAPRPRERAWVRDAVAQTWEAASAVRFLGWGACTPGAPGVHLAFRDGGLSAMGASLDGVDFGACLPLENEYATRVRAAHDFGLILGFADEQNRDDAPASCNAATTRWIGTDTFGPFDPLSVMSGCSDVTYWHGGRLSIGDRAGVQFLYGTPSACTCAT